MKLLYEASSSVEAHMILNLLEQAGLSARIDGEYLQGGVGELQAIGIVRVMIEETNYPEAKDIIDEWDTNQSIQETKPPLKRQSNFSSNVISFLCGIVVMIIFYYTPVTDDGIDYNGDGNLDEKWTYVNYRISKTELDRNFDGKVDFITSFNRKGMVESSISDEDFDGTFETEGSYYYGNMIWLKSDTTGDGFKDYKIDYKNGTAETVRFIDPVTEGVIKIQEFGPFKRRRAQVDTTRDGIMDTVYEYDSIEEFAKKTRNNKQLKN